MSIEPFKYLIQAVALERDEQTGRVLREMPAQTTTVYSADEAHRVIVEFERSLAEMDVEAIGGVEQPAA